MSFFKTPEGDAENMKLPFQRLVFEDADDEWDDEDDWDDDEEWDDEEDDG